MRDAPSDERLAEIRRRRSVAEVADYVGDGLMPDRRAYRDRADLLAEVERLRAVVARVRDMHWRFDIYDICGCREHEDDTVTLADGEVRVSQLLPVLDLPREESSR